MEQDRSKWLKAVKSRISVTAALGRFKKAESILKLMAELMYLSQGGPKNLSRAPSSTTFSRGARLPRLV